MIRREKTGELPLRGKHRAGLRTVSAGYERSTSRAGSDAARNTTLTASENSDKNL